MEANVAQALQASLEQAIQKRFGSEEVALAEYIVVMIQNGKDAPAVTSELSDLMATYDPTFTEFIFGEVARLSNSAAAAAPAAAPVAAALAEPADTEMQDTKKTGGEGMGYPAKRAYANVRQTLEQNSLEKPRGRPETDGVRHSPYGTAPSGPKGETRNHGAGPIRTGRRSQQTQPAPINMAKMLPEGFPMPPPEFFAQIAQQMALQQQTRQVPYRTTRCKAWPRCTKGELCTFAHPIAICTRPNCNRDPGFCPSVHADEVINLEEAIKLQEKTDQGVAAGRAAQSANGHGARPNKNHKPVTQLEDGSTPICRFGEKCTNRACGYTHPSPASKDGSSIVLDSAWCSQGKDCTDPHCSKGHPSPSLNYMQSDSAATPCRFTPCLNPNCRFAHAPGQKGSAKAAPALSNGSYGNKVWTPQSATTTSERSFAAGEAQEKLTPAKDTEMTL